MGVCDVPLVDVVCAAVGGVVQASGEAITAGIGAWIAASMGELAAAAADLAAQAVDSTTAVDLNASWFRSNYEMLLPIGLVLLVATFCAQLVRAAVRRDEQALSQAVTGTVVGVTFQFGAIAVTSVALTVVDALSAGVFAAGHTSVAASIRRIVQVSSLGEVYPLGWAVAALVAVFCAITTFIYWGVMVLRKVAILILVTLAVFAGAGGGWEATRRWRRGWVEATATLVFSKLLMTVVFVLGVAAMGTSGGGDSLAALSDAIAGIVVMLLVLLCPLVTFKFVHWAGDAAQGADTIRTAGAGTSTAAAATRQAGGRLAGAASKPPAPQGPDSVPGMADGGLAAGPSSSAAEVSTSGTGHRPSGARNQASGGGAGPSLPQGSASSGGDSDYDPYRPPSEPGQSASRSPAIASPGRPGTQGGAPPASAAVSTPAAPTAAAPPAPPRPAATPPAPHPASAPGPASPPSTPDGPHPAGPTPPAPTGS